MSDIYNEGYMAIHGEMRSLYLYFIRNTSLDTHSLNFLLNNSHIFHGCGQDELIKRIREHNFEELSANYKRPDGGPAFSYTPPQEPLDWDKLAKAIERLKCYEMGMLIGYLFSCIAWPLMLFRGQESQSL